MGLVSLFARRVGGFPAGKQTAIGHSVPLRYARNLRPEKQSGTNAQLQHRRPGLRLKGFKYGWTMNSCVQSKGLEDCPISSGVKVFRVENSSDKFSSISRWWRKASRGSGEWLGETRPRCSCCASTKLTAYNGAETTTGRKCNDTLLAKLAGCDERSTPFAVGA